MKKRVIPGKNLNFTKEDILMTEKSKPSGYYSPENEAKLPKQTLLVDRKYMGQVIAFWIFAVAIVGAALGVVLLKNVFRAAILLITCFLGVAGIFILLSADFLAAMQILIYVGAIAILVILAIMLTRELSIGSPSNKFKIPAFIIAGFVLRRNHLCSYQYELAD